MNKYNFPIATHSYFRALNVSEERTKFLQFDNYIPKFKYSNNFNVETLLFRQSFMAPDSMEYLSLGCVLSGIRLQNDKNEITHFRQINEKMFGSPDVLYVKTLLKKMLKKSSMSSIQYSDEVIRILDNDLNSDEVFDLGPSKSTFEKYKVFFNNYRKQITNNHNFDVVTEIQRELINSGLSERGWKLQVIDGASHAYTDHNNKKIIIGKDYSPRTSMAAERIAVHEVYGHALRGRQLSMVESEGFAVVLEQLLSREYKPRRTYRYLAASLGWGALGRPMTFREVFEILWRLMIISSKYNEKSAKEHAFGECYRVFRGGSPEVPGAVYLKDLVYFDANQKIWHALSTRKFDYDDFVNIIEGRKVITL